MKRLLAVLVLFGLTVSSSIVNAIPVAAITSFTGGGDINLDGTDLPRTVGWDFTVNDNISVTDLGFWDDALDGLVSAHEIGLWTSGGTLLASTTIQSGTGSPLMGDFRYESIASLLLTAGSSYVIGANIPLNSDNYKFSPSSVTTVAEISFGNGIRGPENAGFAFPNQDPSSGRFGPNFKFELASVPLPTTLVLFGLGLVGLGWSRRKRV